MRVPRYGRLALVVICWIGFVFLVGVWLNTAPVPTVGVLSIEEPSHG